MSRNNPPTLSMKGGPDRISPAMKQPLAASGALDALGQFNMTGTLNDPSKVVVFFADEIRDGFILFIRVLWKKIYRGSNQFMCHAIKAYAATTQFLSWFIFWPLFNLAFDLTISGRENLKGAHSPLIMIANHSRFYDSFLFRVAVGPFSRLLPMRFMAVIKFADPFLNLMRKIGVVQFVYGLFGVFVVEHGLGLQKNLHRAKGILKNKGIVAMFPEGRMVRKGEMSFFRRGVSALALSSHVPVLPLGIKITKNTDKTVASKILSIFGLRKTKIEIRIGKIEQLQTGKTYEEHAADLRSKVQKLIS